MARRSPLFSAALIAAAIVVSVDVTVVLRRHHHAPAPATIPPQGDPEPVATSLPPLPPPRPTLGPTARRIVGAAPPPPSPPPNLEPAPEPPPVVREPRVDPITQAPEPTPSALRWRAQAIADRNLRVIEEADERTFEGLSLPGETRAAVRRINEDYLRRKQELPVAVDPAAPPAAAQVTTDTGGGQPDRDRQAALEQLLGVDGAKTFHDAESSNALRIRPDNGRPWFHQSQQP